jgi:hypothetical protein
MPSGAAGVGQGSICRPKALGLTRCLQPLPATLLLTRWPMRVLAPVIARTPLVRLSPWDTLALSRAVALPLGCNDDAGNVREALEPLAPKLRRGLGGAPPQDDHGLAMVVLSHR